MVETIKAEKGDIFLKQKASKRGRPKKKRQPYSGDLKMLLAFLNWTAGSSTDDAELNALVLELAKARSIDLAELQQGLIKDLSLFTNPPRKGTYDLRNSLCGKIRQFRFPLIPLLNVPTKLQKDGTLKEIGPWSVKPEFGTGGFSDERYFYAMIADGLISRELDKLRRCQHCNRFFVAEERRQIFCIPDHARAYYDDPVRAKTRVYKSRKKEERETK